MLRRLRVDRFELLSGIVAVVGGLVMFGVGASFGWSGLILGDGIIVLAALWLVNRRRHIDPTGRGPGARSPGSTTSTVK